MAYNDAELVQYTEDDLAPLSVWKHRKGGIYVVLGLSICSTNGPLEGQERVVVYRSVKYGHLRHRAAEEFLDGRFQKVRE